MGRLSALQSEREAEEGEGRRLNHRDCELEYVRGFVLNVCLSEE